VAKGNRNSASQGHGSGHHDRAKADQTGLPDRSGREVTFTLTDNRMVNHYNGVLLDDPKSSTSMPFPRSTRLIRSNYAI
jgi:hypothetical protein